MDVRNFFPSKWLKAADLDEAGNTFTIKSVEISEFRDGSQKPSVTFEETDKQLTLNKTNFSAIATLAGSTESTDWVGLAVTLYPSETNFGGEVKECIRIKTRVARKPAAPAPAKKATVVAEAEPDDDNIPF